MTERSRPWDGTSVGDAATEAPYDAPTEFARILRAVTFNSEITPHKGVVVDGAFGYADLTGNSPSANVFRVQGGLALVQGTWYENDANVDFTIPTPATATRVDRIVLRKSWSAQTVRLTRIAGTEGAGVPALTQTFGTTWDVPLWQTSITTGGAQTVTDDRPLMHIHLHKGSTSGGALSHPDLLNVFADQHHNQNHQNRHLPAGGDVIDHNNLTNGATIIGQHGITRLDTTGTQSLGSPVDGKMVYARGNGGTLTVITPSGAILVGTVNEGSDHAIANGDSFTYISNGTNWVVF